MNSYHNVFLLLYKLYIWHIHSCTTELLSHKYANLVKVLSFIIYLYLTIINNQMKKHSTLAHASMQKFIRTFGPVLNCK